MHRHMLNMHGVQAPKRIPQASTAVSKPRVVNPTTADRGWLMNAKRKGGGVETYKVCGGSLLELLFGMLTQRVV